MGRSVLVAICNARGKLDQFVVGCQCKPLPTCDRQRSRPADGDGEPPGAKLLWLWLNRPFLNQIGFDLELLIRYEIDLCIKGLIAR